MMMFPVLGDCLNKRDIFNNDIIAVDLTKSPVEGDIVLCYKPYGKYVIPMFKEYLYTTPENKHMVRTRYIDNDKDFSFEAEEIFGVAVACAKPDRSIRWVIEGSFAA